MLHARGKADEQGAARELKTEFMLHWDGLRSKVGERIVVLAATNRPADLDEAVLRRMPRRIFVPLPDRQSREQILRLILRDEELENGFALEQLAAKTDGYSGSDLKALCVRAAHEPIRELIRAEEADGAAPGALTPGGAPALRPVRLSDFFRAGSASGELVISASVSAQSAASEELARWNERYGESQGRAPTLSLSYYT